MQNTNTTTSPPAIDLLKTAVNAIIEKDSTINKLNATIVRLTENRDAKLDVLHDNNVVLAKSIRDTNVGLNRLADAVITLSIKMDMILEQLAHMETERNNDTEDEGPLDLP
jgi:5-enolpyruvylshikimate-3-phosphate synthase